MNKTFKTILAVLVMVFGFGFLAAGVALADGTNEIKVEVCNNDDWSVCEPLCADSTNNGCTNPLTLFGETNFLPGDIVERNVKITNVDVGGGVSQEIAIEAIEVNNPWLGTPLFSNRFGDRLDFKVEDNIGNVKYEKTLTEFFEESGEAVIDTLANSAIEKYVFSVYFDETSDNKYQDKTLGFNIIFGIKGNEGGDENCNYNGIQDNNETGIDCGGGGCPVCSGGGTGGGGSLPQGLIIKYEQAIEVTSNSATITWLTSYEATSQVIYSSDDEYHSGGYQFDLTEPNYGYAHAVPNPEDFNKIVGHSVTISGLTKGTTYHFRCVSHASPPTVSRTHTFTTLALADDDDKDNSEPTPSPSPREDGAGQEGNNQEGDDDTGGGIPPETYERWVAGATDFIGDALGFSDEEEEDDDEEEDEELRDGEVRGVESDNQDGDGKEEDEWQGGTFENDNGEKSESIFSRYWWWPFLLAMLLIIFFFWYRKKKKKEEEIGN